LADVAQAHQALESGETTGKLVLRTAPPLAVHPADGLGSSGPAAVGGPSGFAWERDDGPSAAGAERG
jgi:hypothetical protein